MALLGWCLLVALNWVIKGPVQSNFPVLMQPQMFLCFEEASVTIPSLQDAAHTQLEWLHQRWNVGYDWTPNQLMNERLQSSWNTMTDLEKATTEEMTILHNTTARWYQRKSDTGCSKRCKEYIFFNSVHCFLDQPYIFFTWVGCSTHAQTMPFIYYVGLSGNHIRLSLSLAWCPFWDWITKQTQGELVSAEDSFRVSS